MSKQNGVTQWWKKQGVTIRAAVIAGIFSLIVAVCGCIGGILTLYANFLLSNQPIQSTQYKLHINSGFNFMTTAILFTEIDGVDVGVVPTKCVEADYGGFPEQFDTTEVLQDANEKSFAFDLVTENPLVITNAKVRVIKYSPPPSVNSIKEISLFDPPGMGGVPLVFFPEKSIGKSTDEIIIARDEGSLRLDPGDAVTLVFPIIFSDPGIYEIKFIVQGQLDLSREAEFVSDTFVYAWFYVDDITSYPIKSSFGLAEMKWIGDCP